MKTVLFCLMLTCVGAIRCEGSIVPNKGLASWYGESHRGRLMANGKPFDPDKLTAASWFYPLGSRVRVTLRSAAQPRSVTVTITDRGPANDLVRDGRIIDLTEGAFKKLASPDLGLIPISVHTVAVTTRSAAR
jgi:rare lipoprotein A